jgi:transcriptional regulator with XRE-family HTH domain
MSFNATQQFADWLRTLRDDRQLSQAKLAAQLGVTKTLICHRELANSSLSARAVGATLEALDATPAERLEGWRLWFLTEGHTKADAEAMAMVKAGLRSEGAA